MYVCTVRGTMEKGSASIGGGLQGSSPPPLSFAFPGAGRMRLRGCCEGTFSRSLLRSLDVCRGGTAKRLEMQLRTALGGENHCQPRQETPSSAEREFGTEKHAQCKKKQTLNKHTFACACHIRISLCIRHDGTRHSPPRNPQSRAAYRFREHFGQQKLAAVSREAFQAAHGRQRGRCLDVDCQRRDGKHLQVRFEATCRLNRNRSISRVATGNNCAPIVGKGIGSDPPVPRCKVRNSQTDNTNWGGWRPSHARRTWVRILLIQHRQLGH